MNEHQKRVKEVFSFFENNDTFLGFRKLLDCVMDTHNMALYKEAIALTDWKEKNPNATDEFVQKANEILNKVYSAPIKESVVNTYVLQADAISKSYGSHKFSLGPVSVNLSKGQVFGLVGENGNGKTTLLRILAKEIAEDSGTLKFNFSSTPKNAYDLRTKLVYIPQRTEKWYGPLLDNLSFVLSNYGVSPEEIETRVLLMVARLGLWNYKHLKWSELSSGYKMRFELARTLLRQPEILLLDEPLANLDILAQQVILEDLKSIANSLSNPIALILSSQQLYEVEKISDEVIFLKNGKYSALNQSKDKESQSLIIEVDTTASREDLTKCLASFSVKKMNYNGGIYVIEFTDETQLSDVLIKIGEYKIPLIYLRDISFSTRRFFVN